VGLAVPFSLLAGRDPFPLPFPSRTPRRWTGREGRRAPSLFPSRPRKRGVSVGKNIWGYTYSLGILHIITSSTASNTTTTTNFQRGGHPFSLPFPLIPPLRFVEKKKLTLVQYAGVDKKRGKTGFLPAPPILGVTSISSCSLPATCWASGPSWGLSRANPCRSAPRSRSRPVRRTPF